MLLVFGQETRNPMAAVLRKAVVMAGRMTAPDDCPTSQRRPWGDTGAMSLTSAALFSRQGALGDGSSSRLAKVLGVALSEPKSTKDVPGLELPRAT